MDSNPSGDPRIDSTIKLPKPMELTWDHCDHVAMASPPTRSTTTATGTVKFNQTHYISLSLCVQPVYVMPSSWRDTICRTRGGHALPLAVGGSVLRCRGPWGFDVDMAFTSRPMLSELIPRAALNLLFLILFFSPGRYSSM
jgi:hypothetical protein